MANQRSFDIVTDIKINRAVWRAKGHGDQPSKFEVEAEFRAFAVLTFLHSTTDVVYAGAPGHYQVIQRITATLPWWRRLGFGVSASRKELKQAYTIYFSRFGATDVVVSVAK